MRWRFFVVLACLIAWATPTRAQDRQTPLAPTPGQGNLSIETESFSLRLRGYLQADWRHVLGDGPWSDTLLVRRARAVFEGSAFHRVEVKIMADFAASPMLYDAYVDAKLTEWLRLRFGKDKVPLSIERLRSARNLLFVERAQPGVFTPVREIGAQIIAEPFDGKISASAGVMQAAPDGVNPDIFGSDGGGDDKDVVGRVFVRPFSRGPLAGLGFGFSGSLGSATGSATTPRLAAYKTTAQLTYFSYRAITGGDGPVAYGARGHFGAQMYFTAGPAEIMAEAIESIEGVRVDERSTRLGHRAYSIQLAFLPTGEHASWDGIVPRRPFDPAHGKFGALVVAFRNHGALFDERSFPTYADPAASVKSAVALGGSLTWVWNSVFELQATWESTMFDGGAKAANRATEHALLARAQAAF
jgi:phosphate-selective porin OprO/OprP